MQFVASYDFRYWSHGKIEHQLDEAACGARGEVGGNEGLAELVAAACGACGEFGGNEGLAEFVVNGDGTATLAPELGSVFF
ncbi:hypothetical protein LWI29_038420 [Acer saccharum]|uniref:Uncharacterized protein n=1 Tax=Acer saccharum TaxID=4024 RepID=A0AA39SID7_ACESA|nr:hypothetical protein LWI29_038420 [Acer saccharum]